MPLKKCPDCGNMISPTAEVCPHCGRDPERIGSLIPDTPENIAMVGIIVAVIVVAVVIFLFFQTR